MYARKYLRKGLYAPAEYVYTFKFTNSLLDHRQQNNQWKNSSSCSNKDHDFSVITVAL